MRAAHAASRSYEKQPPQSSTYRVKGYNKRKDHLTDLMMTKVQAINTHRGWVTDEASKEYARREIEVLLKTGKVSGADLHRIAAHMKLSCNDSNNNTTAPARNVYEASDVSSVRATTSCQMSTTRTAVAESETESDMWARMLKRDVEDWQQETQATRSVRKQRMEEQKVALDRQIEAAHSLRIKQAEQDKVYAKQLAVQLEEWNHEQVKQDEQRKMTYIVEKKTRDDQLHVMRTKKAVDDNQRKLEDEQIIKKLREDIKQEQLERQQQKMKARQEVHRYIEVNKAQNQAKERVIRDEAEMDRLHQLHHMEKLELQEKERSEAMKKIHAKQTRQTHIAQQLAASIGERAAEDERRAVTEQRKKMDEMQKCEQVKEERVLSEREKMRNYLFQQIADKEKVRIAKLKKQVEEKEDLQKELQIAEQQETDRRKSKKQKDMQHRKHIESQIQEKQSRKEVIMSDTEKRLNLRRLMTLKQ